MKVALGGDNCRTHTVASTIGRHRPSHLMFAHVHLQPTGHRVSRRSSVRGPAGSSGQSPIAEALPPPNTIDIDELSGFHRQLIPICRHEPGGDIDYGAVISRRSDSSANARAIADLFSRRPDASSARRRAPYGIFLNASFGALATGASRCRAATRRRYHVISGRHDQVRVDRNGRIIATSTIAVGGR